MALLSSACGETSPSSPAETSAPLLVERTAESGLDFVHVHGGVGNYELPETMGGGVALFDLEGDGDLDVYLAQSGPMRLPDGTESRRGSRNALYRGDGAGAFERVQGAAGAGDPGYGQGVAAGDVDGDGRIDLLSLNWGPNRLYRNTGGAFEDVSERRGLAPLDEWSVSATFFDAEGDGDLDLYVVNYLVSPPGVFRELGSPDGFGGYPHPDHFPGASDRFFLNAGGAFEDHTRQAGMVRASAGSGKSLGVVATDVELDGLVDLYVANDSVPNFLWHNRGELRFVEDGLALGVAYNGDGQSEAGMGVDTADVDGDGDFDLFVTNLDAETNTLYRNETRRRGPDGDVTEGRTRFSDATTRARLAEPSKNLVGFGALFADLDLDGRPDLVVANGHVLDNAAELSDVRRYEQPTSLYLGQEGGRFRSVDSAEVPAVGRQLVSRGSAFGDLDGDGALDLVLANSAGPLQVLFGRPPHSPEAFLSLRLVGGPVGNVHGIGASITLEHADGTRTLGRIERGRSYASASDAVLHIGLASPVVAAEVLWPGGTRERFDGLTGFHGIRTLRHGEGTR